jgi:hypothetical protein
MYIYVYTGTIATILTLTSAVVVFASHEDDTDWLRPLLRRDRNQDSDNKIKQTNRNGDNYVIIEHSSATSKEISDFEFDNNDDSIPERRDNPAKKGFKVVPYMSFYKDGRYERDGLCKNRDRREIGIPIQAQ